MNLVMKATAFNFCFWALIAPLTFSASLVSAENKSGNDSTKGYHIAVAFRKSMVIFNNNGTIVSRHDTPHKIYYMTYDPLNDILIAVTPAPAGAGSLIFRYDPKSNEVVGKTTHLPINSNDIKCITFDYLGNNLYISMNTRILVHSLDTGEETEISYDDEYTYDIVLEPEEGTMYVVLEKNNYFTSDIARAKMNGVGHRDLILVNAAFPGGADISLAYDKHNRNLFWIEKDKQSIYYDDFGNKKIFRKKLHEPKGIAIIDDRIFYTSSVYPYLFWTDKNNFTAVARDYGVGTKLPPGVPAIQLIDSLATREMINNKRQSHPCSRNNGNCSHVCLVTNATDKLCACPPKLNIDFDMKTCKQISVITNSKNNNGNSKNNSSSNRRLWTALIVGLIAFVVYM